MSDAEAGPLGEHSQERRAINILGDLQDIPTDPETRDYLDPELAERIQEDALIEAGARVDEDGRVMSSEGLTWRDARIEPGEDGLTATVEVTTTDPVTGDERVERIPITGFRHLQDEPDRPRGEPSARLESSGERPDRVPRFTRLLWDNLRTEGAVAGPPSRQVLAEVRDDEPGVFEAASRRAIAEMPEEQPNDQELEGMARWSRDFRTELGQALLDHPQFGSVFRGYRLRDDGRLEHHSEGERDPWRIVANIRQVPAAVLERSDERQRMREAADALVAEVYTRIRANNGVPHRELPRNPVPDYTPAGQGPLITDVDGNPATWRDIPRATRDWFTMARERLAKMYEKVSPVVQKLGDLVLGEAVERPQGIEEHAETYGLEFGDRVVQYGDYEEDGFVAFNLNNESGQDAFAINRRARRFVVADGAGGSGAGPLAEATRRLSKELSDAVAIGALNPNSPSQLANWLLEFRDQCQADGLALTDPDNEDAAVVSTLSMVEVGQSLPGGRTEVRVLGIGDSPFYVMDADGNIVRTLGEDEQLRGQGIEPTSSIHNSIGLNGESNPIIGFDESLLVNERLVLEPGQWIVVGSDYLSKYVERIETGARVPTGQRNLPGALRLCRTPDQFADAARSNIPDDATAIAIDPARMARQAA